MLRNEQVRRQAGGSDEAKLLIAQLTGTYCILSHTLDFKPLAAYMYREAPFNEPCHGLEKRLEWWQDREIDNRSSALAVSFNSIFLP